MVIGAPWITQAAPPTMMNATPASHSLASNAGRSVAFGCGAISDPDEGLRHARCGSQPVPRRLLKRECDKCPVHIADGVTNLWIEVRHECGDLGWRYVRNVDCHNERYHARTTRPRGDETSRNTVPRAF